MTRSQKTLIVLLTLLVTASICIWQTLSWLKIRQIPIHLIAINVDQGKQETVNNKGVEQQQFHVITKGNEHSGLLINGKIDGPALGKVLFHMTVLNNSIFPFDLLINQPQQINRIEENEATTNNWRNKIYTVDQLIDVSKNVLEIYFYGQFSAIDAVISDIHAIHVNIKPLQPGYSQNIIVLLIILTAGFFIYWLLTKTIVARQWLLIAMSMIFLLQNQIYFTLILLFLIYLVYWLGNKLIHKKKLRWFLLLMNLFLLIGFLGLFKYFPATVSAIFANIKILDLSIPLGLSYCVFRLIHAVFTWYREQEIDISFREFLCYLIFLPTLAAGPIETINGFRTKRTDQLSTNDIAYGLQRIIFGLGKKILLADWLLGNWLFAPQTGLYSKVLFYSNSLTATTLWPFLIGIMLYAYFDFAGYSDMAIGVSRLFGYRIIENFNWPIVSRNLGYFWQSWHASLSAWCRREIYFPILAITRSNYLALYCAFIVMGLWHSLDINWLAWGSYHGLGLIGLAYWQRYTKAIYQQTNGLLQRLWDVTGIIITFLYVALGFSLVVIQDWPIACSIFVNAWRF